MVTIENTWILIFVLTLVVWQFIRNRLIVATEALRLDIAKRSAKLLASAHLGEAEKKELAVACEVSFFTGAMWRVALTFPIYFLYLLVHPNLLKEQPVPIQDEETRKEFILVQSLSVLSAMTLSPFFAFIVLIEMFLTIIPLSFMSISLERLIVKCEEYLSHSLATKPV